MKAPNQPPSAWWYKPLITIAGGALVLAGIVMLVIPGPGWLTIGAGVAVWAKEYQWAQRWLSGLRRRVQQLRERPGQGPKE